MIIIKMKYPVDIFPLESIKSNLYVYLFLIFFFLKISFLILKNWKKL